MSRILSHIFIEKLLGRFTYKIDTRNRDDITILIAPNGHGKTVLLNIIDWSLKADIEKLKESNFEYLELHFDDSSVLCVTRTPNRRTGNSLIEYKFIFDKHTIQYSSNEDSSALNLEGLLAPTFKHIMEDDTDSMSFKEWSYIVSRERNRKKQNNEISNQRLLNSLKQTDCNYISVQRTVESLEHLSGSRMISSEAISQQHGITKRSNELISIIDDTVKKLAVESQSLDRTFPQRVLARIEQDKRAYSEETIRTRLSELEKEREELSEYHLLRDTESQLTLPEIKFDVQLRNVLQTYLSDANHKLSIIRPLKKKIKTFIDILNEKFEYKKVITDNDNPIRIISNEGDKIDLLSLSSGEQHEFILLYDLIFRSQPGSVFLIDEPEISLHVAWQKRFLSDLSRIRELSPFQAIIATHSPQIISSFDDCVVDLAEQAQ